MPIRFRWMRNWRQAAAKRKSKAEIPRAKRIGFAFTRGISSGRREFEGPPIDFTEINKVYSRDGLIHHAVDKYVELILRSGWDLVGKNEAAIEYVRTRLRYISAVSGISTSQLIQAIVEDVVKYCNSFTVKVRMPNNTRLPVPAQGINGKQPIGAYFPLPPTTMYIAQDKHGNIVQYQQKAPGGTETKEFSPEDIIHIAYKADRGYLFGIPWIWPIIDDVKLLRQLEEHTARLAWKHLFPLIHAQVGLPQEGFQATDEEIEDAIEQLKKMPEDGVFVSSERLKFSVMGVDGKSFDIEPILRYMQQRIFSATGLSPIEFGIGDTANRGTAVNLSESAKDRVKMFQRVVADAIDQHIIQELLIEGGFDPLSNPDDDVNFVFREIDLDEVQKKENGAVFLFEHNAITFDEMRHLIGRDPLTDLSGLHMNVITIPKLKAAAEVSASITDNSDETDNKQQPENQYGKKSNKGDPVNQSVSEGKVDDAIDKVHKTFLLSWQQARNDAALGVKRYYVDQKRKYPISIRSYVEQPLGLICTSLERQIQSPITDSLSKGVVAAAESLQASSLPIVDIQTNSSVIERLAREDLRRLVKDCLDRIEQSITDDMTEEQAAIKVVTAFDALAHRLHRIASYRILQAYNYGFALGGKALGKTSVVIIPSPNACEECLAKANVIDLSRRDFLSKIPPFHASCQCQLDWQATDKGGVTV